MVVCYFLHLLHPCSPFRNSFFLFRLLSMAKSIHSDTRECVSSAGTHLPLDNMLCHGNRYVGVYPQSSTFTVRVILAWEWFWEYQSKSVGRWVGRSCDDSIVSCKNFPGSHSHLFYWQRASKHKTVFLLLSAIPFHLFGYSITRSYNGVRIILKRHRCSNVGWS